MSNIAGLTGEFIAFAREMFGADQPVHLHVPDFSGREKEYVMETIETTIVSSVGRFVDRLEAAVASYTGARHAVATANGTCALHMALMLAGVEEGDEVITQPVTFVATANAIRYCGAHPVFVDIDESTLGLSPEKLEHFLKRHTEYRDGQCVNKATGRAIPACVPVHTLGHPAEAESIQQICEHYGIVLVEDAAESLGSFRDGKHTGLTGAMGTLSFNGNKTITTGGGGMILMEDESLAKRAKHLTTTAKLPHLWAYEHDEVGYNYRMPNLNAALGCAQMERLEQIIERKRKLAETYAEFFARAGIRFLTEPDNCRSNYWLNAIVLENRDERDIFLENTNRNRIATRPLWQLMNRLPMFKDCQTGDLSTSERMEERVVTIPSGLKFRKEPGR